MRLVLTAAPPSSPPKQSRRLPLLGLTLTVGRCLSIGFLGYLGSLSAIVLALRPSQAWLQAPAMAFLKAHSAVCVAMFLILRAMVRPVARPVSTAPADSHFAALPSSAVR
jgi:hypothetical protein